jgi:hypothetical protein
MLSLITGKSWNELSVILNVDKYEHFTLRMFEG